MNKLRIAVSQFPVTKDIHNNEMYIKKHIIYAAEKNADVVHFPETALSGYETDIALIDWALIKESLNRIKRLAKKYNIYIVLGLHQKQTPNEKPYNSVCLISKTGEILGWYSKKKLYGVEKNRFSINQNFFVGEINNIKCGFLICYDSCFPELFQYYREHDVKVLFLSYYNANNIQGKNSLDDLMEAQLITRAADNMMYISGSNSSSKYSRMPSVVASPDGKLIKLKRHEPGVLIYDYPDDKLGWTYDNRMKE